MAHADTLRVAFLHAELSRDGPGLMLRDIHRDEDQVQALRRVIDRAGPDILILAGVDYDRRGMALNALNQGLARPFPATLGIAGNIGRPTGLDLDGDGRLGGAGDRQAFGRFAGQSGMAILSRHPIAVEGLIDLSVLLWRDVPDSLLIDHAGRTGAMAQGVQIQRLSTGGHWMVPVTLPDGGRLTLMGFHAGPPVFDGPEDRNGRRNHDEILLWRHLLDGALPVAPPAGAFVLAGAANADPFDGDGIRSGIAALLGDPRLQDPRPTSAGAAASGDPHHHGPAGLDTVAWTRPGPGHLRVDYVLPSAGLTVAGAGVIWPPAADPFAAAVATASRHRLVWVDLALE